MLKILIPRRIYFKIPFTYLEVGFTNNDDIVSGDVSTSLDKYTFESEEWWNIIYTLGRYELAISGKKQDNKRRLKGKRKGFLSGL